MHLMKSESPAFLYILDFRAYSFGGQLVLFFPLGTPGHYTATLELFIGALVKFLIF